MRPLITLYTPGTRPELVAKAARVAPDAVIIDLEDTVPYEIKDATRETIAGLLPTFETPMLVRINSEPEHRDPDIAAIVSGHVRALLLPMAEDPAAVRRVDKLMGERERELGLEPGGIGLIPLIETTLGVVRCYDVASATARVESVSFGSAEDGDLQRELSCAWSLEGTELLYARSKVQLEARAAKLGYVLDGAFSDLDDTDALRADCELSKRLGYDGRTLVHPRQVAIAREVYAPSDDEVAYYTRVVAAFEEAEAAGEAAIRVDGKLIDYAMYKKARDFIAA